MKTLKKKFYYIIAGLLILLMVLPVLVSCSETEQLVFEETRPMMDTYVRIVVYSDEPTAKTAISTAFDRIEEVINIASTFDENAEAFKLNQDGYITDSSPELLNLISLSLDYYNLTDGAFDITVQPLLDLWSFNPTAEKQFWELDTATQETAINEAMKLVGSDKIVMEENKISFSKPGIEITLSAIAKGYTVDEALKVIKDSGIGYALVDAGGDIGTLGSKPNGELWQIALVNPDNTSESLATFRVSGKAVATSGNYQHYFDPEATVGHIMDPKTGYSASDCISVTIVANNCTYADTLATGVFVMGPQDGLNLVESLDNVECLIVDAERKLYQSSGLSKYLK
ncbi:FAD:protein FMN transferase [Chloroflexota bacterium]